MKLSRREFLKSSSASLLDYPINSFEEKSEKQAKIFFGGDTLFGGYYSKGYGIMNKINEFIDVQEDISKVPEYYLKNLSSIMQEADLRICNLEGPITKRYSSSEIIKKIYPKQFPLRQHEKTAEILKSSRFDLVSLANNHAFDFGEEGLVTTIEKLTEKNISYIGAGKEEAYQPNYLQINKIKFAFFGITDIVEPANMVATNNRFGVASIPETSNYSQSKNLELISENIKYVKDNSDFVCIMLHSGPISGRNLNSRQIEISKILSESGTDLIIGHHSHAAQSIKNYNTTLTFHGIGNLIFGGRKSKQQISLSPLINFSVSKNGNKNINYKENYILPNENQTFTPKIA